MVSINTIGAVAITLVVLVFILGMGIMILGTTQETYCSNAGGTWGTYNDTDIDGPTPIVDPITDTFTGCCATVNSTFNDCDSWEQDSIAYNTSGSGITAVNLFGDWLSIIVLVVIMSILIGLIYTYFKDAV